MTSANQALADLLREVDRLTEEIPNFISVGEATPIANYYLLRVRDAKDALDRASGHDPRVPHASRSIARLRPRLRVIVATPEASR